MLSEILQFHRFPKKDNFHLFSIFLTPVFIKKIAGEKKKIISQIFLNPPLKKFSRKREAKKMVCVLLSALVARYSVSFMRDSSKLSGECSVYNLCWMLKDGKWPTSWADNCFLFPNLAKAKILLTFHWQKNDGTIFLQHEIKLLSSLTIFLSSLTIILHN